MRSDRGFTLVELLIYATIFTITAGLLTAVLFNVTRVNDKQVSGTEVAQQLNFVLSTVQNLVNEASLIESVYEGASPASQCSLFCTLKLRMSASSTDPTFVSSDASGVYLKQGDSATSTLTNDRIKVDKFILTKFEFEGGHASVRLDMAFTFDSENARFAVTRSIQSAFGKANAAIFDDHLIPGVDNSYDVGQSASRWRDAAFSQNVTIEGSLAVGATSTDASALLDLKSTTLGLLPPRMTTAQRDAISSPAAGLLVYNNSDSAMNFYDGSDWAAIGTSPNWTATSTYIYNANAGNVGIGASTAPSSKLTVTGDIEYTGNLKPYRNSTAYTAYTFVPLTTGLNCTGYDYSLVSSDATIDLQSACGVPAGIKAVSVGLRFQDASAGTFVSLAPVNTGNNVGAVFANLEVAGQWTGSGGVVPTDSNGDIVVDINGAVDSMKIVIWGYWI